MFIAFEELHGPGVALVNREHIAAAYPEQTEENTPQLRLSLAGQASTSLVYFGPSDITEFEFKKRVESLVRILRSTKDYEAAWTKANDQIVRGPQGTGDLY